MSTTNYEKWRYIFSDLESPDIFIDFTLYWTISSALQRRVFLGDYNFDAIFANIYVMFVANPGVGKSRAARQAGAQILKTFRYLDPAKQANGFPADKCWTDYVSFSADDTTIESLIQQLNRATRTFQIDQKIPNTDMFAKKPVQHASMSILLSEEMSSMFKRGNEGVPTALNQWYDAQDYSRQLKTKGNDFIKNVCVTMLGCTTPDNVRSMMKMGILQQGLTARVWPIYSESPRHRKLHSIMSEDQIQVLREFRNHVEMLLKISGQVKFSSDAEQFFIDHYEGSDRLNMSIKSPIELSRINFDKRCDDFYGRIKLHTFKMCLVLHFLEFKGSMEISLQTVIKAMTELNRFQPDMHKALASSGANPLFEFYKKVHDAITENKCMTTIQLKLAFGEDLDDIKLDSVIKHLGEIGKIKFKADYKMENGKTKTGYIAL